MRQLGGIQSRLSNMWFNKLGSLFLNDQSYSIGRCLYPSLIWQGRDEFDDDDIPRGPFMETEAFYMALIHAFLAHLKELPMEHHLLHAPVPIPQEYENYQVYRRAIDRWNDYVAIGSKMESAKNRLDYAMVGISLTENVPLLVQQDKDIKCNDFPLCHPDLSFENIFVDEELNITCIIDWAFASSIPPSMPLVCPGIPHPRDGAARDLRMAYAEGFIAGQGLMAKKTSTSQYMGKSVGCLPA